MNKKGIALILGYIVIIILTMLGAIFLSRSVVENKMVTRHSDATHAFWIAEAGLSRAFKDIAGGLTPPYDTQITFGNGSYVLSLPLGEQPPWGIKINSTGTYGTAAGTDARTVSGIAYRIAPVFDNTISSGSSLHLWGAFAQLIVDEKTRLTGTFQKHCVFCTATFDDKVEGVQWGQPPFEDDPLPIPDYNTNGTPDEFADFQLFGQAVVNSYPPDQRVYIQSSGTVNIYPDTLPQGTKVVYVEGTEGQGDVNIFFDGSWEEGEDLTIISTGDVNYVQPLQYQEDARLSVIAWSGYNEGSIIYSNHESVVYSHDDIDGTAIVAWSETEGNYISKSRMDYLAAAVHLEFNYSNRGQQGDLPPGFALLAGSQGTLKFKSWQEYIE